MKYNDNQLRAIHATHKNVTVFASAGAGKTTLLIERLIKRMRDDRLKISEICAMTFTEAAASEMRKRLAFSLTAQEDPFLQEQLPLLPSAHISTIHSFCLFIIKNYGYIIGVSPKSTTNIVSDHLQKQLAKMALEQLQSEMATQHSDLYLLLCETFSSRPDHDKSLLAAIVDCASTLAEHPEPQQLIDSIHHIYHANHLKEWPQHLQKAYWDYHTIWIESLSRLGYNLLRGYDQDQVDQDIELASIHHIIQSLQHCLEQVKSHDLEFRETFFMAIDVQYKSIRNAKTYSGLRLEFVKQVDTYIKDFYDEKTSFEQLNTTAPIADGLLFCAERYNTIYTNIKRSQDALDFNDLEHLALEILLANQGYVSSLLKKQFKEVMVDEYQDTNPIQDRIIQLISSGNNTFRVGDVKQSIYGFRGAKPDLMRSLTEIDSSQGENIYLSNNYRSKHDIVHFNNLLFTRLMNIDTFKDRYSEHDFVEIGIESQHHNSAPVEVHELMIEESDLSANQAKAMHIANQMIRFHQEGYAWRDMVVLTRSHATKFELKYAFDRANIPYFIDERTGFYHANIVQDMLALLKLSLNPSDEYVLVQVLTSLYYQFSDQALAELRLSDDPNLYSAFQHLYPALYQELEALLSSLSEVPLHEAIIRLIAFRSLYQEKLNLQQKTNVDLLHEKALQFTNNGQYGIIQFIQSIDDLEDQESAQAIPVSAEDDVVNVMTIHQSKGLQYPVVFFWSNESKRHLDLVNPWVMDLEFGLGLNCINLQPRTQSRSLIRILIEYKKRAEETEENIRLLYVALTRAQERMVIVDVALKSDPIPLAPEILFSSASFTHYIHTALQPSDDFVSFHRIDAISLQSLPKKVKESTDQNFPSPLIYSSVETIRASMQKPDLTLDLQQAMHQKTAMEKGTLLHQVLETLPNQQWTLSMLLDQFPDLAPQQIKDVMDYNSHSFTQELYQHDCEHEFDFVLQYNQQPLYGVIDFLARDENSLWLVDFKTDRNVTSEQLVERHHHQIELYKYALEKIYPGSQINAYIYSFYLKDYIHITS